MTSFRQHFLGILALCASCAAATTPPPFVPMPAHVQMLGGWTTFPHPTLVATDPRLKPAAELLASEIHELFGVTVKVTNHPEPGAIALRLQPVIKPHQVQIWVKRGVVVVGGTPRDVLMGTATLLQSFALRDGELALPNFAVDDVPKSDFRGLLIDVARKHHSIAVLKQCVVLCYLYKLNYLQLHLTDDQSFTFPSKACPQLSENNPNGSKAYTRAELAELVRFADQHGVAVIPEMDIPGHSARLVSTMPDLFKIKGTKPYEHHASINFAKREVVKAVETLVGEMCEVFWNSPYFHMGGDEADIALADQNSDFQQAFEQLGLPPHSQQELFRGFIGQVDAMVRKRGRQLIVWEGFGQDPHSKFPIPKDVKVMEFENAYYLPQDLLKDGYTLINASWTPLYVVNRHVWPAKVIFNWGLSRFGRFSNLLPTTEWFKVPSTDRIIGAEACSWEGPEESEIENLRRLVPAMAERIWNPAAASDFSYFNSRFQAVDPILDRLIHPVGILSSDMDAVDPSGFDVLCFTKPATVWLSCDKGKSIRYTLDGTVPNLGSPVYTAPLHLTQTTTVRAVAVDVRGKVSEYESAKTFYYVPPKFPNLATGKKVTSSSGTQHPQNPELAVDDNLDLASSWWAGPAPQWLQVDLGKVYSTDRIEIFPYWDGHRYYQYTVEVSTDGKAWTTVLDKSANTTPSSNQGDEVRFSPRLARFVRVNMLRGSANEAVHLVELRVWEAKR